jgi:hypothetical protein
VTQRAPARAADAALDAAMLALALGAALNLSLGQIALGCAAVLLAARAVARDERLWSAAGDLGPALGAPLFFLAACAISSVTTRAGWPGLFEATRWRPLCAIPVGALALAVRGPELAMRCALVFALGCAVNAGVGAWQVATGCAPLADLLEVPPSRRLVTAPGRPDLLSAVGLFYNRVRLSHVLAGCILAGLFPLDDC